MSLLWPKSSKISIHSLVKRETNSNIPTNEGIYHFNPLPRKEGDVVGGGRWEDIFVISIHSLVKRETSGSEPALSATSYFNPLPRKEGDFFFSFWASSCETFQSTPS